MTYSSWAQQSKLTTEVLLTGQTLESNIPSSHASKDVSHTYFDGLGRPLQSIAQEVTATTGTSQDIVSFYTYSQVSANPQTFLPYVKTNTLGSYQASAPTEQASFYSNAANGIATDASPKMETVYEKSPLGRVLESGGVGTEWQPGTGHTIRYAYRTNHANEVRLWSASGTSTSFYAQDALWVTEVTNENGNKSLVYQDKRGRTLLVKRQLDAIVPGEAALTDYEETHYVYDTYGRLKNMVPPQAISLMKAASNWNVALASVQELVYSFVYDEFGRLIEQKVPGMGWYYTVYDNFHRPILRQDANLRASNKWSFTKFDSYGRVAYEGILTNNTYNTRSSMQAYIASLNYEGAEPYFENRTTSSTFQYYSQQTKPNVTATEVMVYYYYDDHNVNFSGGANATFKSPAQFSDMPQLASSLLKGKLTAIKKRVVGTSTLLTEYYFYDKYGRNIQVIKNNYLNTASLSDTLSNQFDFSGKVLKTLQKQTVSGLTTTILRRFEYYNQGQLKAVFQKNNADTEQRVAYYNYNKLGQLAEKNLHYKGTGDVALAASYLQSVDYKFNIKGWLSAINSSALTAVAGESADIFGMELFYNTQAGLNTTNAPYYNGNISAVKWKTNDAASNTMPKRERSYRYAYDKHERLSSATYMAKGTSWNMESGAYNVENVRYDHNGNLKTMDRWTKENDVSARVKADALSYFYDSNNPNRIKYMEDAGVDNTGFKDANGSTLEYTYDGNGNLVSDLNKGLSFTYNELNKIKKATKDASNYIEYVYDASGARLQKKTVMGANTVVTTYLDGIVYENGALAWFGMPEGRVSKEGSALEYQYIMSDHQGNSRMMFRAKPSAPGILEVLQENHYDPYGLPLTGLAINTPIGGKDNEYLYNGPGEWEADLGLNIHNTYFRDYDPTIGRFNGVDPLAASFANESPYVYGGNNPISFNDPLGDQKVDVREGERESWVNDPFPNLAWAMDFHERGGGGGYGASTYRVGPGSSNHWSDAFRSFEGNVALMSPAVAYGFYGQNMTDAEKWGLANTLGHKVRFDVEYKEEGEWVEAGGYIRPKFAPELRILGIEEQNGGDGPGFWDDNGALHEAMIAINEWNPLAVAVNSIKAMATGTDINGRAVSNGQATFNLATVIPIFKLGKVVNVLGSTGRVIAANLTEQLAMQEIMSNPAMGRVIMEGMTDPRWNGWSKMAWNNAGVEIHYVAKFENGVLKYVDDFKFK
ncbi:RHS repeat domain-containing protein [Shiella aurantiaca]|uniref:RHS repeat domain-containing protein n=1 Tax=Shiella aurantiaca TaxID=3058365 RepID=UPI0029F53A6E|nr:DUF6443 domain-containing protein [Shiella aurantiaca]